MIKPLHVRIFVIFLLVFAGQAHAQTALIAVAANFAGPIKEITSAFQKQSPHQIEIATGATTKFYTQILHGAPFDVLLSADDTTVTKLVSEKQAIANTQFTYAIGHLVLWSAKEGYVDQAGKVLSEGNFQHLAIANPALAPYGKAAIEALNHLGLNALSSKFVTGENIAQAHQFVSSGNAALGFVARSQVEKDGKITHGSAWLVPQNLYTPILQDAVLLNKGQNNEAAKEFLLFLKTPAAKAIIQSYGYTL